MVQQWTSGRTRVRGSGQEPAGPSPVASGVIEPMATLLKNMKRASLTVRDHGLRLWMVGTMMSRVRASTGADGRMRLRGVGGATVTMVVGVAGIGMTGATTGSRGEMRRWPGLKKLLGRWMAAGLEAVAPQRVNHGGPETMVLRASRRRRWWSPSSMAMVAKMSWAPPHAHT